MKSRLYTVSFIKPCETDKEKVTAEIQLKIPKPWNSDELCSVLRNNFLDVKCSEKLGIVRVSYLGKVLIFTTEGRVTVRKAENREDVLKTAGYLAELFGLDEQ